MNEITDINVLENVNFKNLKILFLGFNKITDINVLEKVNFDKLEDLDLSVNNISDITVFDRVKFKLKDLCIGDNKFNKQDISSIITKLREKIDRVSCIMNN